MTASPFSAFGVEASNVSTDPFAIPRNKYNVMVTGAEVKELKDIPYFIIELTISDPASEHSGKNASQMLRLTPWADAERPTGDAKTMNARTIGSYKKALLSMGIREEALSSFDPHTMGNKFLGIKGTADIGPNNKGYNNVFDFERTASTPAETVQASEAVSSPAVNSDELSKLMSGL